jgi:hypothetical protein
MGRANAEFLTGIRRIEDDSEDGRGDVQGVWGGLGRGIFLTRFTRF